MSKTIIKIEPEWNAAHCSLDNVDYDLPGWIGVPEELQPLWEQYKPYVTLTIDHGILVNITPCAEIPPEDDPPQIRRHIEELKTQLNDTDYKIIKCSEYQLAGKEMPYDVVELHQERQGLRDEINALEEHLKEIEGQTDTSTGDVG